MSHGDIESLILSIFSITFIALIVSLIISLVFKMSFKNVMLAIVSGIIYISLIFLSIFMAILFFIIYPSEKNDVKEHFKFIVPVPFPEDAKIVDYDCGGGFGGGGYICSASIEIPFSTYQILKNKIEDNESITKSSYPTDGEKWSWELMDDNQTVYFEYVNY
jgi:hypothetical protein